jgi:hypothetical protein
MKAGARRTEVRVDEDGVRTVRTAGVRGAVWLLAAAIVLVGAFFLYGFRFLAAGSPTTAPDVTSERRAGAETGQRAPRPAVKPPRRVVPRPSSDRAISGPPPAGVEPSRARPDSAPNGTASDAAADPDEPSGIALFPPPGTDPPKSGIIVPEDFVLPDGYVRHHQATDDGRALPPILMFHPDYEFVDENGAPVKIPDDRVVPPELAPQGLTVQMLEVPDVSIPMIEPEGDAPRRGPEE